jgi:hypothetical protein
LELWVTWVENVEEAMAVRWFEVGVGYLGQTVVEDI